MPESYSILAVDDSPENLNLILTMFDESVYEILIALDGASALTQAEKIRPDLILLDVMMPGMNGFETCFHLRRNSVTCDIPVIFMTALADTSNKLEGFRLGAVDYITKPFDVTEVLARVKTHLKLSHLQKELLAKNSDLEAEVTRRKQVEMELRTAHARIERQNSSRLRAIMDNTADGIVTIDEYGTIESFNQAAEKIFGYTAIEILGQDVTILMPTAYWKAHRHSLQSFSPSSKKNTTGRELMGQRKDGSLVAIEVTISEMRIGEQSMFISVIRDVTERKQTQAKLMHLVTHDALTNLPNRYLLQERIERIINQVPYQPFALILLDCDRFKNINDSLGHLVGDKLLICITDQLRTALRPNDFLARFVGDKFAILLQNLNSVQEVIQLAESVLQRFIMPFEIAQRELFMSVSMGIALSRYNYKAPEDIIRDADTAMYQAKMAGRACYKLFNNTMHQAVQTALELETELRQAWQNQTFTVHYQPIVNLKTGQLCGFEALARWEHPEKGFISPDTFIPLAEDIGLIIPLGQWVLYEACLQLKKWQQFYTHRLIMSVNISASQFKQTRFPKQIDQILAETNLTGDHLHLEITESLLMDNMQSAISMLDELKKRHIHLSIDDFGTGYSSFSYLHRLPVDILKIDRSFIQQISLEEKNTTIVETIIDLAHNLGLQIIAEGIENSTQLYMLRQLQGEYGQGYFFSKPIMADEMTTLLYSQPTWLPMDDDRSCINEIT